MREFKRILRPGGLLGAVLRHHRREWFDELLAGLEIEESGEVEARTMNGNPARIVQLWARKTGVCVAEGG